jgi:hypothetical protein
VLAANLLQKLHQDCPFKKRDGGPPSPLTKTYHGCPSVSHAFFCDRRYAE